MEKIYPPKKCEYINCDVVFTPANGRQRYHCRRCYLLANRAELNAYGRKRRAEEKAAAEKEKEKSLKAVKPGMSIREIVALADSCGLSYGEFVSSYAGR